MGLPTPINPLGGDFQCRTQRHASLRVVGRKLLLRGGDLASENWTTLECEFSQTVNRDHGADRAAEGPSPSPERADGDKKGGLRCNATDKRAPFLVQNQWPVLRTLGRKLGFQRENGRVKIEDFELELKRKVEEEFKS